MKANALVSYKDDEVPSNELVTRMDNKQLFGINIYSVG